jgi:hypothetical protein
MKHQIENQRIKKKKKKITPKIKLGSSNQCAHSVYNKKLKKKIKKFECIIRKASYEYLKIDVKFFVWLLVESSN